VHRAFTAVVVLLVAGCDDTGSGVGATSSSTGGSTGGSTVSSTSASSSSGGVMPGGTVTEVGTCDAGNIAGTQCTQLAVQCPGVAELEVGARVTQPAGAVRGVITVQSGGGGNFFQEDFDPRSHDFVQELVTAGFVVVSRSWAGVGWFEGSAGVRASSCRGATLLGWIDQHYRDASKPFCAMGFSGGAIELSYALARWDAADRLDGALIAAGPSMSQLDLVCPSVAPATWLNRDCGALAAKYGMSCGASLFCTLQGAAGVVDSAWTPAHPCTSAAEANVADLSEDSIVASDSRMSYPNTKVRFVSGALDCSATVLLYVDAITTDRSITLAPATAHDVLATDEGLAAMREAVKSSCASY